MRRNRKKSKSVGKPNSSASYMSPTKASSGKTPNVKSGKPKRLYLIRHGESLGQTAKHNGLDRKTDPSLLDAGLSHNGIAQAKRLALDDRLQSDVELVVSSPLTRALHTAVLGFGMSRCEIVVQYDLRELGSRIPENTPRNIQHVLKDVKEATELDGIAIDYTTFMPDTWPVDRYDGKATKTNSILRVMKYLYEEREEETIAVVCHYNVIREIICDEGKSLRPVNADPIVCTLYHNGEVRLGNKQTTG